MLNKYLKYKNGIALVEVVAALGIAVVVITSLVSLAIFTMRSSLRSKLLLEGTKHASRQIELLRAYRDNPGITWDIFKNELDPNCTGGDSCNINENLNITTGKADSGPDTPPLEQVYRYFTVTNVTNDSVDITAVAEWQIGGETKSTHMYTTLTNWRNK